MKAPHISIVTPVYGCGGSLPELCERLTVALAAITPEFEILLVNDASPDGAWEVIRELADMDGRVRHRWSIRQLRKRVATLEMSLSDQEAATNEAKQKLREQAQSIVKDEPAALPPPAPAM